MAETNSVGHRITARGKDLGLNRADATGQFLHEQLVRRVTAYSGEVLHNPAAFVAAGPFAASAHLVPNITNPLGHATLVRNPALDGDYRYHLIRALRPGPQNDEIQTDTPQIETIGKDLDRILTKVTFEGRNYLCRIDIDSGLPVFTSEPTAMPGAFEPGAYDSSWPLKQTAMHSLALADLLAYEMHGVVARRHYHPNSFGNVLACLAHRPTFGGVTAGDLRRSLDVRGPGRAHLVARQLQLASSGRVVANNVGSVARTKESSPAQLPDVETKRLAGLAGVLLGDPDDALISPAYQPRIPQRRSDASYGKDSSVQAPGLPHVTILMPCYSGSQPFLARAAESVLEQSYPNLTLLVLNDGAPVSPWPHLAHIDDPRLVRFDLPTNEGCFFAREVGRQAAPGAYVACVDADDVVARTWLARCVMTIMATNSAGSLTRFKFVDNDGTRYDEDPRPRRRKDMPFDWYDRSPQERLHLLRRNHAVLRSESIAQIGGYFGGYRNVWDKLYMSMLMLPDPANSITVVHQRLYTQFFGDFQSTEAGPGSSDIDRIRAELQRKWTKAHDAFLDVRHGRRNEAHLIDVLQEITQADVNDIQRRSIAQLGAQLTEEVGKSIESSVAERGGPERLLTARRVPEMRYLGALY